MQRVRIGLTGLAGVFLLVVAAAAFLGLARKEPGVRAPGSSTAVVDSANANVTETPKEPLAELGVTPGNLPEAPVTNAAAPGLVTPAR
jgi:hypothetical protein